MISGILRSDRLKLPYVLIFVLETGFLNLDFELYLNLFQDKKILL
jgi:hypothetical protein